MRYMLDTNICIYVINRKPQRTIERFKKHPVGSIVISSITMAELKYGAYASSSPEKNLGALAKFTSPIEVLDYREVETDYYGRLRAFLRSRGKLIGPNDMHIAAHALSTGCVLVTNNLKEFRRVPDLKIENWA